jgi:organic hydroperoxide reductase OsmC/OhrA
MLCGGVAACYVVVWQHVMWWCGSMLCGGVAACYVVVWQHVMSANRESFFQNNGT